VTLAKCYLQGAGCYRTPVRQPVRPVPAIRDARHARWRQGSRAVANRCPSGGGRWARLATVPPCVDRHRTLSAE